jgi:cytochrome c-type biogenesis protein CcmF
MSSALGLFGTCTIYAALVLSLVGISLSVIAGFRNSTSLIHASRFCTYAVLGCVATASATLIHALVTHDFSLEYVASFSDETMPLFYLLGAFWGGQAGSLLYWTLVVSGFSGACLFVYRDQYRRQMPWVTLVCLSVTMGLLLILTFGSNPFETYGIIDDPLQGKGLNPLLQTPKMVIHPPTLLAGLASMTIPFAFAMAGLITRDYKTWVAVSRRWIIVPWFFLSIGNMLGGMWAYEELGWGGYWAWDAVENAAFMPWLLTTALLHSLMIQERRGMLKRWNIGLTLGAYILTIFGTYITRSGLIESVHTFAQSEIGDYFLVYLITVTAISSLLFVYRWDDMKSTRKLDSPISREAAFILNNWLFVAMFFVVFFGTMWPRIKEGLFGQEVSIGPAWFNRWMAPLGLLLLLLMGIGTVISWRRATWTNFQRNFVWPIVYTVIAAPVSIGLYWHLRGADLGVVPSPNDMTYAVAAVGLIFFVLFCTLDDFIRAVRARQRSRNEGFFYSIWKLVTKQPRRYGGYLVHMGILCAFLAFAGNALKIEKDLSIQKGETFRIADYTFLYQGTEEKYDAEKLLITAPIEVYRNGHHVYSLRPGKAIFHASPQMPTSEIDIQSGILEDLYVHLVDFNSDGSRVALKVFVGPFTWWFWFGGVILILGSCICMWPRPLSRTSTRSERPSSIRTPDQHTDSGPE